MHPGACFTRIMYAMKLPLLTVMSFLTFLGLGQISAIEVGSTAPTPSALDENARTVHFADVYQQGVTLVYFYPKADTPGCTAQACSLRDSFAGLKARGVQVLGVSADKPEAQRKFREKYQLPFTLIADSDGVVAKAFGVPTFLGFTKRQSFLVKDGKVVWRDLSVSPKTHLADVNAALDALK
jgi:peroxiredoxin Q/BCP